jgi:hypothetical protein
VEGCTNSAVLPGARISLLEEVETVVERADTVEVDPITLPCWRAVLELVPKEDTETTEGCVTTSLTAGCVAPFTRVCITSLRVVVVFVTVSSFCDQAAGEEGFTVDTLSSFTDHDAAGVIGEMGVAGVAGSSLTTLASLSLHEADAGSLCSSTWI